MKIVNGHDIYRIYIYKSTVYSPSHLSGQIRLRDLSTVKYSSVFLIPVSKTIFHKVIFHPLLFSVDLIQCWDYQFFRPVWLINVHCGAHTHWRWKILYRHVRRTIDKPDDWYVYIYSTLHYISIASFSGVCVISLIAGIAIKQQQVSWMLFYTQPYYAVTLYNSCTFLYINVNVRIKTLKTPF